MWHLIEIGGAAVVGIGYTIRHEWERRHRPDTFQPDIFDLLNGDPRNPRS